MTFLRSKKGIALGAATVVAVVAAIVGYAYFTASGSGTGTATVGTASSVQLSSDPVGGLLPGAPATPVTVHVHNPGSGNQFVDQINGAVQTDGSCLGSWFSVAPISFAASVAAGATSDRGTTIAMTESNTNQDACQGKPLTINWSTGTGSTGGGGGSTGGCPASVPNATLTCVNGTWTYTCLSGFADVDQNATNGCEVNLMTNVHNCGRVGNDITLLPHVINATCINGVASFTCASGWSNANGNPLDGCETAIVPHLGALTLARVDAGHFNVTVLLDRPAPSGTEVSLTSSDPSLAQVPSSVAFPPGTDTMLVQCLDLGTAGANITASLNGEVLQVTLTAA